MVLIMGTHATWSAYTPSSVYGRNHGKTDGAYKNFSKRIRCGFFLYDRMNECKRPVLSNNQLWVFFSYIVEKHLK